LSTVPIICVKDVEKTSKLLQLLFGWKSEHGGPHFDDLVDEQQRSVLWLHDSNVHQHPRFAAVGQAPLGVGVSIYVKVKDIEWTFEQAKKLGQTIVEPLHFNENAQFREFTIKLADGYHFTVCEKNEWLKI